MSGELPLLPSQAVPPRSSVAAVTVRPVGNTNGEERTDWVAVEEPLEIILEYGDHQARSRRTASITMRTPGQDEELAAGFLFAEGVVRDIVDLQEIVSCSHPNAVRAVLRPGVPVSFGNLERHFATTSSCGACGKTSIEALAIRSQPLIDTNRPIVSSKLIHRLPELLRDAQTTFDRTGGLHAAALFDCEGRLLAVREDVGRHNAVDKVIGSELLAGHIPLSDRVLLVSGRVSFELVQKALAAGIPVMAAVGAPSSLAVELATQFGLTLIGFVRDHRFNVYAYPGRLLP